MVIRHRLRFGVLVLVFVVLSVEGQVSAAPLVQTSARAPVFVPHIIAKLPHNTRAFTEGFELYDELLYESSAMNNGTIAALLVEDPQTDQILNEVAVPQPYFAEGIGVT